jgi:hypothetical protein
MKKIQNIKLKIKYKISKKKKKKKKEKRLQGVARTTPCNPWGWLGHP